MTEVFEGIYQRNGWNGKESLSGPGSGLAPTRRISDWLVHTIDELGIRSVLDVGCGDNLWMPDLPDYTGIDVSPTAIERARSFHPDRKYAVWDARDGLPPGRWGVVFVRDVLQHLSFRDGKALIRAIAGSDARWLIASTYTAPSERHHDPLNTDIQTGGCYSPDLTAPPFDLPSPSRRQPDGWDYDTGSVLRDRAKWLGVWRLTP
jgi:SAM-dependent methyltransferase